MKTSASTEPQPDENATLDASGVAEQSGQRKSLRTADEIVPQGATIGRYVVLGVAGHGGMGVVYRAYDPELQREVALKLLRPQGSATSEVADARLRREAQAMARVSHPNVLPVYDAGALGGRVWIAMEFLQAQTLGAWLATSTRGWREIVAMFLQAGRGLAAAHAVGLVHRDFKPPNVLVGPDGRARVMDFGLARSTGVDTGGDAASTVEATSVEGDLTAAGSVVGTPRYMAPEQHYGKPIDGRADQFAFCVALFEALYGVRAFTGDNMPELALRKQSRRMGEVSASTDVPNRVHRIVMRGLEPDPEQRFASMDALLAALADDAGARRRRWLISGIGGVLVAAGIGGGLMWIGSDRPCRDAARKLVGVWDDERRARVGAAMRDTGLAYAADASARVERSFDDYATAWASAHDAACAATEIHGEQSDELLDARIACLDRARAELGALVDVLEQADATVVEKSVQAAAGLRPLVECEASPDLLAIGHAPRDAESMAILARIEPALARGSALSRAGKPAAAARVLEPAVVEARALGFQPLLAELLRTLSDAAFESGDVDRSRTLAIEGLGAALAGNARRVAANILIDLVFIDGHELQRPERAHEWARLADGMLSAIPDEILRIALLNAESVTAIAEAEFDAGERFAAEAVSRQRALDPSGQAMAHLVGNLGAVMVERGRYSTGRVYLVEAVELDTLHLGAEHPETLLLRSNLAAVDVLEGRYEAAIENLTAIASVQARVLGDDHTSLGNTLNNLANAHRRHGQLDEAIAVHRRALAVRERAYGSNSTAVAQTLDNLSIALRAADHLVEARALHVRAMQIRKDLLPADHPEMALGLANEAELYRAERNLPAALVAITAALALRNRVLGPTHAMTLATRILHAQVLEDLGDHSAAIAELEAVLAEAEGREIPENIVAPASFALAQLIPDRVHAGRLARTARALWVSIAGDPIAIAEIDAWIAANP